MVIAPLAQWIERWPPEPKMEVRFCQGAPLEKTEDPRQKTKEQNTGDYKNTKAYRSKGD